MYPGYVDKSCFWPPAKRNRDCSRLDFLPAIFLCLNKIEFSKCSLWTDALTQWSRHRRLPSPIHPRRPIPRFRAKKRPTLNAPFSPRRWSRVTTGFRWSLIPASTTSNSDASDGATVRKVGLGARRCTMERVRRRGRAIRPTSGNHWWSFHASSMASQTHGRRSTFRWATRPTASWCTAPLPLPDVTRITFRRRGHRCRSICRCRISTTIGSRFRVVARRPPTPGAAVAPRRRSTFPPTGIKWCTSHSRMVSQEKFYDFFLFQSNNQSPIPTFKIF